VTLKINSIRPDFIFIKMNLGRLQLLKNSNKHKTEAENTQKVIKMSANRCGETTAFARLPAQKMR
jgi:cell division protein FtsI/penicillin-binding protein 2